MAGEGGGAGFLGEFVEDDRLARIANEAERMANRQTPKMRRRGRVRSRQPMADIRSAIGVVERSHGVARRGGFD